MKRCLEHNHYLPISGITARKVIGRCSDGRVWTKYNVGPVCYFVSTDEL